MTHASAIQPRQSGRERDGSLTMVLLDQGRCLIPAIREPIMMPRGAVRAS